MPAIPSNGCGLRRSRMPEVGDRQDDQDAQQTMRAERTERPDGRYLIYYSWSEQQPPGGVSGAADDRPEAPADV